MKWESDSGYLPVPSEKDWGVKKELGFGGNSILDNSENELMHYGIPGMKWGVRTKEYIAKRLASSRTKREAERKRQYEEGYNRGRRVASNTYFIKNRVANILAEKKRREEEAKGSLSDRFVDKNFDKLTDKMGISDMLKGFGLDEKAKDYLKDFKDKKIDDALDWMQTENGQKRVQSVANFLGKSTSKAIGVGVKAAPYVKKGAKSAGRAVSKASKGAASAAAKAVKSGYKWLREGDPSGSQKIKMGVRKFEKAMSRQLGKTSVAITKSSAFSKKAVRYAHESLGNLLRKRPRRHS